jgi:hypothetical protein
MNWHENERPPRDKFGGAASRFALSIISCETTARSATGRRPTGSFMEIVNEAQKLVDLPDVRN